MFSADYMLQDCYACVTLCDAQIPTLLSYAEVREDVTENFVGGYGAEDGAEMIETLAEVLAYDVAT